MAIALNHGAGVASPSWKLYHNPHYYFPQRGDSRGSPSRQKDRTPMIVAHFDDGDDDNGGGMERQLGLGRGYGDGDGGVTSVSELLARVEELGAELEFERRMRRKVEALNEALAAELAEERRRVDAERARTREDLDEERRMLRVAELWREERVRMKLADAQAAVEEKLREAADAGHRAANAAAAAAESCSCRSGSPVGGKASPATVGQQSPASSQHGQHAASGQQHSQSHRREVTGGENPHIRRGIKGFVEFPRAVRVRPRGEERVDLVSNIECQRAQLRVLMRHRSPAAASMPGLVDAAPNNLVV